MDYVHVINHAQFAIAAHLDSQSLLNIQQASKGLFRIDPACKSFLKFDQLYNEFVIVYVLKTKNVIRIDKCNNKYRASINGEVKTTTSICSFAMLHLLKTNIEWVSVVIHP